MTDKSYNLGGSTKPPERRFADLDGPEFYPTPQWATWALLENVRFTGTIWECACGNGAMSKVLEAAGHDVYSSDLHDRGYGERGIDFLSESLPPHGHDNIITNPPFHSAAQFVHAGLKQTRQKLALLLRLAFLESAIRYEGIFRKNPPFAVFVFTKRVTFYPEGVERKGSGTTAYAWFVWDVNQDWTYPRLNWIPPEGRCSGRTRSML